MNNHTLDLNRMSNRRRMRLRLPHINSHLIGTVNNRRTPRSRRNNKTPRTILFHITRSRMTKRVQPLISQNTTITTLTTLPIRQHPPKTTRPQKPHTRISNKPRRNRLAPRLEIHSQRRPTTSHRRRSHLSRRRRLSCRSRLRSRCRRLSCGRRLGSCRSRLRSRCRRGPATSHDRSDHHRHNLGLRTTIKGQIQIAIGNRDHRRSVRERLRRGRGDAVVQLHSLNLYRMGHRGGVRDRITDHNDHVVGSVGNSSSPRRRRVGGPPGAVDLFVACGRVAHTVENRIGFGPPDATLSALSVGGDPPMGSIEQITISGLPAHNRFGPERPLPGEAGLGRNLIGSNGHQRCCGHDGRQHREAHLARRPAQPHRLEHGPLR